MEGKTLVGESSQAFGLDHLARCALNAEFLAIKVGDDEVYSRKSFVQCDFFFEKDVGTFALE